MTTQKPQAAALHYDGKSAPRVIAKGEGFIAEKIIQIAKENNIPISQNKELLTLLAQVKLNREIPPQLYTAVAELLTFLYHLDSTN